MKLGLSALALAAMALAATPAVAAPCLDYTASNGTTSFPGTFIGTVGQASGDVCTIGTFLSNGTASNSSVAKVGSDTPSIYQFFFAGGDLTITESLGNNGTGPVTVELFALSGQNGSVVGGSLATDPLGQSSAPSGPFTIASDLALSSGFYALENFEGTGAPDPNYAVGFAATSVPEPMSLALLGAGLAGFAGIARRKRKDAPRN